MNSRSSRNGSQPSLVVVMGAGGHGRSVADALIAQCPGQFAGFVDDDHSLAGASVIGYPVLGDRDWLWEQAKTKSVAVAIGLGNPAVRREFLAQAEAHGVRALNVAHPSAIIAQSAQFGVGSVVLARAIVNANARIGQGAIIGAASTIEHDVEVGDFTLIGPNVVTGGGVRIGADALIGIGAQLLPGVAVGAETTVGAGSIVTRDLPGRVVAFGVPARPRRPIGAADFDGPDDVTKNSFPASPSNRILLSPPHLAGNELQYLNDAIVTNWVAPIGPHVDAFEREFAKLVGTRHAVAVASGTAAMHLAIRHLRLQPGDEVFCSTATFAATVNPVLYEGGSPVFIDSDPATWNMDCNLLSDELARCAKKGRLPRAVIVVDLYGQCADWDALREICGAYEVPLIEDAAEALGATYKDQPAGCFGWANIFSFNGNKIITTSGGGMLATNDGALAAAARHLATQARDPAPHYEHSQVGYNYRMSNLLAGVGRAQLAVLPDRVKARRAVFDYYREHLGQEPGIELIPEAAYGQSNRWLTCVLIDPEVFGATAEDVRLHLEAQHIESRPAWKPMHLQPVFQGCRSVGGDVAAKIFEQGLCLPSGSALTTAELDRVVSGFLSTPRRRAHAAPPIASRAVKVS